jgi:hypothetical protein
VDKELKMNEPMYPTSPLLSVASILQRPVEKLQELDRQPLSFAFLEGRYEIFVVRDLTTGETFEVAINLENGRRVDPAELRSRDRERATVEGHKLAPELLELLLRHADLEQIQVRLHFSLESVRPLESREVNWSDPDLRWQFQARLDAELRKLQVEVPLRVPSDSPVLEVILSARQVVKLNGSPLIESIDLVAEPEIPDD